MDFKDYRKSCRFCFKPFSSLRKSVKISELIVRNFKELTQTELVRHKGFSRICTLCDGDLQVCTEFRQNLLLRQHQLCKSFKELKPADDFQVASVFLNVKTELDESYSDQDGAVCSDLFNPSTSKIEQEEESDNGSVFNCKDEKDEESKKKKGLEKINKDNLLEDLNKRTLEQSKADHVACLECSKMIDRKSIKEHLRAVHLKAHRFECELCDYKTERQSRLLRHISNGHHEGGAAKAPRLPTNGVCELCGKMVYRLKRHIKRVHLKVKNVHCDLCSFGAYFKYDIEQHMKVHIGKEAEKYVCNECGHEFKQRSRLNEHVKRNHTDRERRHACEICGKQFYTTTHLINHRETHTEKEIPCETCGRLFVSMRKLKEHLPYHQEPRFLCDFPDCDRKFFVKKQYKIHLKVHQGQKDYKCDQCDKSYFVLKGLRLHVFAVHNQLRFFCQVAGCNGDFTRREYYKKHVLSCHKDLGPNKLEQLLEAVKLAMPAQKT